MRTANWTIVYRDDKLDKDFYVHDIFEAGTNFNTTSDKEEAILMCWSAAKALAEILNASLKGGYCFITLI